MKIDASHWLPRSTNGKRHICDVHKSVAVVFERRCTVVSHLFFPIFSAIYTEVLVTTTTTTIFRSLPRVDAIFLGFFPFLVFRRAAMDLWQGELLIENDFLSLADELLPLILITTHSNCALPSRLRTIVIVVVVAAQIPFE